MFNRRVFSVGALVLAFGALAAAPGCDWLKGSEPGQPTSPVISRLGISAPSVPCGVEFTISFHYEDLQGDIDNAKVTLLRSGETLGREELFLWPSTSSKSGGVVSFPLTFTCGSRGGIWSIKVQTEDAAGHLSNELYGEIRLNAAG